MQGPPPVDHLRRRILGVAAIPAAAELAPAVGAPARAAVVGAEFPALRRVNAGPLEIAYAELGPADGPVASCCTAGPTTSTPSPKRRRRWRPAAGA